MMALCGFCGLKEKQEKKVKIAPDLHKQPFQNEPEFTRFGA